MLYNADIYAQHPRVEVVDGLVPPVICRHFIDIGKKNLKPSQVIQATKESKKTVDTRTSMNSWIAHNQTEMTQALADQISDLVKIPLENAEKFQLIHYKETQEYKPHYDAFDPNTFGGAKALMQGGQRILTALIYLNNVPEGGGTSFPNLGFNINAKQGRMVIFHNLIDGTSERHPDSKHGGMPVLLGEKWAINLWFRESKFT